jgi:hypothetical protein
MSRRQPRADRLGATVATPATQVGSRVMWEVVVGVVLTAAFGGLLVPTVKSWMDRRRERFNAFGALLDTLASCLWTYWKLAMRVAYYGSKGPAFGDDYTAALKAWDSDEAWDNGGQIQIQISRSKRLLPPATHENLDETQQKVVDDLDTRVEDLRQKEDTTAWDRFYQSLDGPRRDDIQRLLVCLTQHVDLAQQAWPIRRWRTFRGKIPPPSASLRSQMWIARSRPNGDPGKSGSGAAGAGVELGADDADKGLPDSR